jgi:hypothetical protein
LFRLTLGRQRGNGFPEATAVPNVFGIQINRLTGVPKP